MPDSHDRNLDTQARRLAEISAAIDAALAEDPEAADLPTSSGPQTYGELTDFNDGLRDQHGWADIDLDAALTDKQRRDLEQWRHHQRLPWETSDIAMIGVAGLVGMLAVWCDSAADGAVASQLNKLSKTKRVRKWEAAGKRLPIDYMGQGFGGRAHRVKSAGHDLARPIEALRQIMDSEFRGVLWSHGERENFAKSTGFRQVNNVAEAAAALMQHLAADVLTTMSLPIPGMSLLHDFGSESMKQFAEHAYSGLRAGKGWNIRSATVVPGFSSFVTELIIRTHSHVAAYRTTGSAELSPEMIRKRTELLLAAHTLVGAASIGKAAASLLLIKRERNVFHPAAIRHIQIPALLQAGRLAIEVVDNTCSADEFEATSWDDLVLDVAMPWQLDLAAKLEGACTGDGLGDYR